MAMMHNGLLSYYERIFAFKQYHKWEIAEIESLLPWELDVMTSLLNNYLETLESKRKQDAVTRNSMA